ncbi:MAG: aminoglycoside phosphotransferase family protein [Myxococcota bacterium]|nr:phosphotransferase [Deltaproteobacteria bacterium]MDQ3334192.1 aminoglycoside phosphotransferase family protein [Myxococcota bacterium]
MPWFAESDLTPDFFEQDLRRYLNDAGLSVQSVEVLPTVGAGTISRTQLRLRKFIGTFAVRIAYRAGDGRERSIDLWLKSKPIDEESKLSLRSSMLGSGALLRTWQRHHHLHELTGSHERENLIAERVTDPRFLRHVPRVVKSFRVDAREAYVLLFEHVGQMPLMDTFEDVTGWTLEHAARVIRGLAQIHSVYFDQESELLSMDWLEPVPGETYRWRSLALWEALAEHVWEVSPDLCTPALAALQRSTLRDFTSSRPRGVPCTLIHNNATPRNLGLREVDGESTLCIYDWEVATIDLPQHDLAQFLCWTLSPDVTREQVASLVGLHRTELEAATGRAIDAGAWTEGFRFALRDVLIRKVPFLLLSRLYRNTSAAKRVVSTLQRLVELV